MQQMFSVFKNLVAVFSIFILLLFPLGVVGDTNKSALEKFSLDDLKIYSIESRGGCILLATIIDPEQYIHTLLVGDFVGKNRGEVIRIESGEIVIKEVVSNKKGGWAFREVTLNSKSVNYQEKLNKQDA